MLEILGVWLLSSNNKKHALNRGRKPGLFVALTFILWFGAEFLGVLIGVIAGLGALTYLLALGFAALDGLASYLIARNCTPGNDVIADSEQIVADLLSRAERLTVPAVLDISMQYAPGRYEIALNGQLIGLLDNTGMLTAETWFRQNALVAKAEGGREATPFVFNVENGVVRAQIKFIGGRFDWKYCGGIAPINFQPYTPPAARYCSYCGNPLTPGDVFCSRCGKASGTDTAPCGENQR
jgi:hypothetical protein